MTYSNEGLVDLGMAERIDVDGAGAVENFDSGRFVRTFWTRVRDGNIWVRAPRLLLVMPNSALRDGGYLQQVLAKAPTADPRIRLHS